MGAKSPKKRRGEPELEYYQTAPMEGFDWRPRHRKKQQEATWADFDKELTEKIQRGEFAVDPETKEVAPKRVGKHGQT